MVDLDRIEAFYAPKRATEDDDPSCCPRCLAGVCVEDGEAEPWSSKEGDYCDTCEREVARNARSDVPALVAELRAARAEIERLREAHEECAALLARAVNDRDTAAADERADVVAWLSTGEAAVRTLGGMTGSELLAKAARRIEQGAHVGAAKGGER